MLKYHSHPAVAPTDQNPLFPLPLQPRNYPTVYSQEELHYYNGISVTQSDSEIIEKETRDQSNSKLWHSVRFEHVTASNFKRVYARRADFDSLAVSFLRNKRTVQTKAMKRGIAMENEAAAKYTSITGNSILLCGFVINPNAPHLGTSPDRRVIDHSGE